VGGIAGRLGVAAVFLYLNSLQFWRPSRLTTATP
jgi:hypothetical protein